MVQNIVCLRCASNYAIAYYQDVHGAEFAGGYCSSEGDLLNERQLAGRSIYDGYRVAGPVPWKSPVKVSVLVMRNTMGLPVLFR